MLWTVLCQELRWSVFQLTSDYQFHRFIQHISFLSGLGTSSYSVQNLSSAVTIVVSFLTLFFKLFACNLYSYSVLTKFSFARKLFCSSLHHIQILSAASVAPSFLFCILTAIGSSQLWVQSAGAVSFVRDFNISQCFFPFLSWIVQNSFCSGHVSNAFLLLKMLCSPPKWFSFYLRFALLVWLASALYQDVILSTRVLAYSFGHYVQYF